VNRFRADRKQRWKNGAHACGAGGWLLFRVFVVGLGLLLTRCPANRDGMPGQLAQAMDETAVASRSGALALDLWLQRRSTAQLTSLALTNARDEVVKAYKGIAELKADGRLTESMTTVITQLNAAAAADALESGYR
jgi:hypothetical protein